uniref:uncharacterized protein LOC124063298 n=1 Tax=Scatophagus argus TaxID=75038 RepID=UPI001ED8376A|nr:uncharacterized protein LOC124063298 [Scatophagus argus]
MESLKTALKHFADYVSATAGVYTTVIVIFTYHVLLEKDLACTCKEQSRDCWLYMFMPAVLIFILMLWMDKTFQRIFKYLCGGCLEFCCSRCSGTCICKCLSCCVVCYRLLKAAFLASLWAVSVLIDGDWYVCCHNNQTEHKDLACQNKANITAEEQGILTELANDSRVIGWSLLLGITFLAAFMSSIPFRKCSSCCKTEKCRSCFRFEETVLEEIVLEEGEKLIPETLRATAKEKMTEKLQNHKTNEEWGKCFDVAEEVVREISTHAGTRDCASPPQAGPSGSSSPSQAGSSESSSSSQA